MYYLPREKCHNNIICNDMYPEQYFQRSLSNRYTFHSFVLHAPPNIIPFCNGEMFAIHSEMYVPTISKKN